MSRPKGYADWKPKRATLQVLSAIEGVFDTYREYLPLTNRQIFYRLVALEVIGKTEKEYKNLCNLLVRARRAGYIPFDWIRDDGAVTYGPTEYQDGAHFWQSVIGWAEDFQKIRQERQRFHIEVWCEAAGMAPQLSRTCKPYGIDVWSTGGFSSVTVTHEIAERCAKREVPTVFLHIGDHDPSGVSIFTSMSEDVLEFVRRDAAHLYESEPEDWFRARRVALVPDQIKAYDLPMAPAKLSDSRTTNWEEETCQAEAMPWRKNSNPRSSTTPTWIRWPMWKTGRTTKARTWSSFCATTAKPIARSSTTTFTQRILDRLGQVC